MPYDEYVTWEQFVTLRESDDTVCHHVANVADGRQIAERWHQFTQDELESLLQRCEVDYAYAGVMHIFCFVVGKERHPGPNQDRELIRRHFIAQIKERINCGAFVWMQGEDQWGRVMVVFSTLTTYRVFRDGAEAGQ